MKAVRRPLCMLAVSASLLLLPVRAWACACCSNTGDYYVGSGRPNEYRLGLLREMRFDGTAYLYMTEAGREVDAKGLLSPAENYSLSGSLVGRVWRLTFRQGGSSGALNLPLPARMTSFAADIHDGQTSGGGGPLLYKEWRFEGPVTGTGFFRAGLVAPARYSLVLQGRGNGCDNAEDFTRWRLQISGRRAAYAFFGELGEPRPGGRDE